MAQEHTPGEIALPSGIYTIAHDPAHSGMPPEVAVIKGRRFFRRAGTDGDSGYLQQNGLL